MQTAQPMTREQVRRFDRIAIEQYAIPGIVLMENAGRNAARVIRHAALPQPNKGSVAIACGSGNNGGDGFVIARHLMNCGIHTGIFLAADPARLAGDALTNYRICEKMRIPITDLRTPEQIEAAVSQWERSDVLVDALLGTGFEGSVRAPMDAIIPAMNRLRARRADGQPAAHHPVVVAIDLPSGLDADTGRPANATVEADLTITMVARKIGFDALEADRFTGRVIVVDIGAPPQCAHFL